MKPEQDLIIRQILIDRCRCLSVFNLTRKQLNKLSTKQLHLLAVLLKHGNAVMLPKLLGKRGTQ